MLFGIKYEDWQVIGIVLSTIISTLAFLWTLRESRKNSKESKTMIEESTRPIIVIYSNKTNAGGEYYYLIIKNYGKSIANIKQIKSDFDFVGKNAYYASDKNRDLLHDLENSLLAPGQSKQILIDYNVTKDLEISIKIVYSSQTRTYSETVKTVLTNGLHAPAIIPSTKDKELKHIVEILHDTLIKKL